ncbi:hypothetical protein HELRODRAFT_192152 [Helobdella robusta]|uniref:SAP domain-containing protein n=1 Tax=Helobdella robusta TaxID=6412 RepID=T1FTM9_HELRO|nr:hypothetical protein HELRODRAFT_192152 [Helobdella robusta]ESO02803.1 hypothetical protein HELRODRAFT_192152 [Helobdella robusta]
MSKLCGLNVVQLREELQKRSLVTSGNKEVLVARLREALIEEDLKIVASRNMFVENLLTSRSLTTTHFVSDTKQSTDFFWFRDSGIRVNLGVQNVQKASGRRQESYVWEYFQYDPVTDRSTCLCEISSTSSSQSTSASRVCGKTLKGKNATNLKTHLEYFHSDAFNKVKDKEKVKNKLSNKICNASGSDQKTQPKIATFVDKINAYNENSKVYKDKLDAVVDLFAKTSLPLSLLDCPVFQQFVNTMDSQFKLPVLDLVPAAATLLDLRYNWTLLMSVNSALLSMAKKYIVQKINVNCKDSNQLQIDQDLQQRPAKRFKLMTSLVLPTCSQSRTDKLLSVYSDVEEEIDRYISKINSQLLPEDEDSIVAWSKKTDLPLLSGIAPNILALPCSQAFVERLFSTCSILTEGRRNKLSNNLEKRLFLKHNLQLV